MKRLRFLLILLAAFGGILYQMQGQQKTLPVEFGDAVATCGATSPEGFVIGLINVRTATTQTKNVNWGAPMYHHETWRRKNLGQVFGIAIDNGGDIYTTATSVYPNDLANDVNGTNIVGPSGWGAIYRIDGTTGAITTFATLPNSPNVGLGNICYDPDHDQFFVTNLEDGKIYRLSSTGTTLSTHDPFSPDGGTTGFAPLGERLWGIAYRKTASDNGRIYFGRWQEFIDQPSTAAGNEIHSIALDATGAFSGGPVKEIDLPVFTATAQASEPPSDIEFAADGRMLVAERGWHKDKPVERRRNYAAHRARVLEYQLSGVTWTLVGGTGKYSIGGTPGANSAGGVAWGYTTYDATLKRTESCDATVWASGDAIHYAPNDYIYGLQQLPSTGGNVTNSTLIDLDGNLSTAMKADIGDVDIYKDCVPPDPCSLVSGAIARDLSMGVNCCWDLTLTNNYSASFWTTVTVEPLTSGVTIIDAKAPANWIISAQRSTGITFRRSTGYIPLGANGTFKFCLNNNGNPTQQVKLTWRGKNGVLCTQTINLTCTGVPTSCGALIEPVGVCETFGDKTARYKLTLKLRNNSAFTINNARFYLTSPAGAFISPSYLSLTLAPGATSAVQTFTVYGVPNGNSIDLEVQIYSTDQRNSCVFKQTITLPKCTDCCENFLLVQKNRSVKVQGDGSVQISSQVTSTPPLLRRFKTTIVSATRSVACPMYVTPVTDISPVFLPGSTFTPNPPMMFRGTFNTGELDWGENPTGSTVQNTPLNLRIGLPQLPPAGCTDTIDLCIKYTYTDVDCRTCDTVMCDRIIRRGFSWWWDLDPYKLPLGTDDENDGGSGGAKESDDPAILSGTIPTNCPFTISMVTPTTGQLIVQNFPPPPGGDPLGIPTIHGFSIEPTVGTDLISLVDNVYATPATVVDRVGSITLASPILSGQTRTFNLVFNNYMNHLAYQNFVKVRVTIPGYPGDTLEPAFIVYARTPGGKGGDEVVADPKLSLTNVRTYGLKLQTGNSTDDSVCRVVIGVDTVAGDDGIIAIGPPVDTASVPLQPFLYTSSPEYSLLMEHPADLDGYALPVRNGETVTPIYVTVCGGVDSNVTFTYATYNSVGEMISSGSFTATTPLAARRDGGGHDEAAAYRIEQIEMRRDPATDRALLRFSLEQYVPGIQVRIIDRRGREVATMVKSEVISPGIHEIDFNTSELPGGTYFYTLRAGDFTQTRRMEIVR